MKFNRVTINLPEELKADLEQMKRNDFYDKSLAELIRHLIYLGIKKEKETKENE